MIRVADIITGALRLIRACSPGGTPLAGELSDGLEALNILVDALAADGIMVYRSLRETYALTPNTQTYTIGSGGDFDTGRPTQIDRAGVVLSDGTEAPLGVLNISEWARNRYKTLTASIPTDVYYDPAFPLGNVLVWPVPTSSCTLALYLPKPVSQFASVEEEISLPPRYARALKYNLAAELAPEYNTDPSQQVLDTARETKLDIARVNSKPWLMSCDEPIAPGGGLRTYQTG